MFFHGVACEPTESQTASRLSCGKGSIALEALKQQLQLANDVQLIHFQQLQVILAGHGLIFLRALFHEDGVYTAKMHM